MSEIYFLIYMYIPLPNLVISPHGICKINYSWVIEWGLCHLCSRITIYIIDTKPLATKPLCWVIVGTPPYTTTQNPSDLGRMYPRLLKSPCYSYEEINFYILHFFITLNSFSVCPQKVSLSRQQLLKGTCAKLIVCARKKANKGGKREVESHYLRVDG